MALILTIPVIASLGAFRGGCMLSLFVDYADLMI